MSDNNQLIYPTVDLFLYDLADGLGESETTIEGNRRKFWQKIYGENLDSGKLETLKQIESTPSDYIELLGTGQDFTDDWDGYYYAVKIGDTYALQVDCSGKILPDPQKFLPQDISKLKEIKDEINNKTHKQPATIGQSWLIWGQLTSNDQSFLETAKNCYQTLDLFPKPNWENDLKNQGEILGAICYELWRVPPDNGNLEQNYHLMIYLFPYRPDNSVQVAGQIMSQKLYPNFLQLFRFRNKIIWSYYQSRQLKAQLKQVSPHLQTSIVHLPKQVQENQINLTNLQQNLADNLTIYSIYADFLSKIEDQEHTLKYNLINYQKRLQKIANLDSQHPSANTLEFLETFSDFAIEKYLPQVEADRSSFNVGLRLLENTIKTIEGIINIEQTKSEQTLAVTVGIAGLGLAVSGITATIASTQIPSPNKNNELSIPVVAGLSFGILIPFIVILFGLLKIPKNPSKNR